MATIAFSGGYDNDFVDEPPKSLECSICLLTLRNPTVISCCGNHFCEPCIGRIKSNRKPCPLCNSPDFTTFLHKGVAREVNALRVYCPKKAQGCDWQGELGQVDRHLNPPANSRGCGFVMVECQYRCGGMFERRMIDSHETDDCAKRPIEVQMAFLARRLETLAIENRDIKTKFEAEITTLKAEIEARSPLQLPPFYFTVINYERCKNDNHVLMSPPFYSHPKGYKMCLQIHPNGCKSGLNTHMSLLVSIMRGEFDDTLQWPFTGRVTIDICNKTSQQWTQVKVVNFKESPIARKCDRLTSGSKGYFQYIPQDQVAAKYMIKDGTTVVRFRVNRVELI